MTDSVLVFPPGFRVLDANGDPVSGAKIKFFEVGPGATKLVYSDKDLSVSLGAVVYTRSDGFPVTQQSGNTTTLIYVGSSAYYVVITDSADVALFPAKDNVKGAVDTSTFLTAGGSAAIPFVTTAIDLTLDASHKGKMIGASAACTLTLTAAATLGDDWNAWVRNDSASSMVGITAAENIHIQAGTTKSFALRPGAAALIICNGATFELVGPTASYFTGDGVLAITSRVNAAPGGPTAGARYIATGVFSATPVTTAVGDIIEATGQGTWFKITPPTDAGWLAFVKDENAYYSFQDSAWVALIASDTVAGFQANATQSAMETATSTTLNVTPGRQQFHPGHAKAQVRFSTAGAIVGTSYGVASTAKTGTGTYTVTMSTAMANTNYGVCQCPQTSQAATTFVTAFTSTTVFGLSSLNSSFVAADSDFQVAVFGDQ